MTTEAQESEKSWFLESRSSWALEPESRILVFARSLRALQMRILQIILKGILITMWSARILGMRPPLLKQILRT